MTSERNIELRHSAYKSYRESTFVRTAQSDYRRTCPKPSLKITCLSFLSSSVRRAAAGANFKKVSPLGRHFFLFDLRKWRLTRRATCAARPTHARTYAHAYIFVRTYVSETG